MGGRGSPDGAVDDGPVICQVQVWMVALILGDRPIRVEGVEGSLEVFGDKGSFDGDAVVNDPPGAAERSHVFCHLFAAQPSHRGNGSLFLRRFIDAIGFNSKPPLFFSDAARF